ncbi:hypothetical protein [Aliiglaciecola sp. LCG003]|uniref:hypothetical protein n=1 Tax=Aliiglaciecola sp. LCG003 TaxID=3053655 RepID=UPI002573EE57|nr:hypothetical protein [Aliiglaciecola sp. LCG003]WJG09020.1 hypothetical protein QR722_17070 [Aliiglaciecola sp. LCG003]
MLRVIRILSISFLLLLASLLAVLFTVIETRPTVIVAADHQVNEADSIAILLQQAKQITRHRFVEQEIEFSKQQVNSVVGFIQRALPNFAGELDTQSGTSTIKASYKLPVDWFNAYVNVSAQLVSANQIQLQQVKLGDLPISGDLAMSLLISVVNWRTHSDLGDKALAQVSKIEVSDHAIKVTLIPIHDFLMSLNQIKNGLSGVEDEALRAKVAYYLAYLAELDIPQHSLGLSLSDFIQPLFAQAMHLSVNSSADKENEAAILALAIYTGHHRLANFVGDVQPMAGKVVMPKYRPMLAKRSDLTQHFIISAALKILSEQGISSAIGEFKELMDRGKGGSGFSFADLAADLAGIEFAIVASDIGTADAVQRTLSQITDEQDFFPDISDLPEGLSKQAFEVQYLSVEGDEYLSLVKLINDRIANLPLYQSVHGTR